MMCKHGRHKWTQDTPRKERQCAIHYAIRQRNIFLINSIHADQAQCRALYSDSCVSNNVVDDGSYNVLCQGTSFVYERLVKFEVRHRELSPLLVVLAVYLK